MWRGFNILGPEGRRVAYRTAPKRTAQHTWRGLRPPRAPDVTAIDVAGAEDAAVPVGTEPDECEGPKVPKPPKYGFLVQAGSWVFLHRATGPDSLRRTAAQRCRVANCHPDIRYL